MGYVVFPAFKECRERNMMLYGVAKPYPLWSLRYVAHMMRNLRRTMASKTMAIKAGSAWSMEPQVNSGTG
jgi:hypothetical protein